MTLRMALNGTTAGDFWMAALVLLGVKVVAFILQIVMMRGNYEVMPKGGFFRAVYFAGKATPALALVCAYVSARLVHDHGHSRLFGCAAVFAAVLAIGVVRLRKQGKFFGLLDVLSSR